MADIVLQHNVGQLGALKRLALPSTATAASTGDATTVTGITIDRFGFGTGSMPGAAALAIAYEAVLQTSKTISFGYAVQDSADGSNWSDYLTATYAVAATGSTTASAVAGEFAVDVDLNSARRYVRFNYNPDLSATGTDTLVARAVGFFAGFDRLPG